MKDISVASLFFIVPKATCRCSLLYCA